ncbi:MAG: alpha/beta hydrolase [Desulfotignum sp.]|nr:alpha/beta hydrolase [Desulfotignum sp.]
MTWFLTVGDTRYEICRYGYGRKNRPVLVFLHEGLGCVKMWKTFPRQLAEQAACDAFVFSRSGYGKSDPDPLPWKLNFMHTQALKVLPDILAAARIDTYILIGHSDGGSIALIHAGSRHAAPGLKAVITEAAHVFCEPVTLSSIQDAATAYVTGRLKEKLARFHEDNTDNAFWGWNGAWLNPNFVYWDIQKFLPRIQVPVLAFQGETDPYGTRAQLAAIREKIANCDTRLIKDCGHAPHIEQPDRVLSDMAAFIQAHLE